MYKRILTRKLFYKKWVYKVKCRCFGSWSIKHRGADDTILRCTAALGPFIENQADSVNSKLMNFAIDVKPFLEKEVSVRVELNIFTIYCKDKDLFDQMCHDLEKWIIEVHEPANHTELSFMVNNPDKIVLCNQLPFNAYKYKVFLKCSTPENTKQNFYNWSLNYKEPIKIPESVTKWLSGKKRYLPCPVIYVKDQSTLCMTRIFLGGNISKVDEFVPRSMINIVSKEQTCPV